MTWWDRNWGQREKRDQEVGLVLKVNERDREDPSKLFPVAEATNKGRRSHVLRRCQGWDSATGGNQQEDTS